MPAPRKNSWSLKKIIKKAEDVNLNTAIALSKSIIDEEKATKRRAKKETIIPLHLMKTPKEIQDILNFRVFNVILQPFILKITNEDSSNKNRIWNRTSLYCDIKPGDLSYDNINLTELMEYYVPALMPPICVSEVHVGDKIMNMSLIPGREKSFLFSNDKNKSPIKSPQIINTSIDCKDSSRSIDYNYSFQDCYNNDIYDDLSSHITESLPDKESPEVISVPSSDSANINPSDFKPQNESEIHRFMKMFNNSKYSDLLVLLKSGNILFLHKFILVSWLCDEEIISETQHCILDVEDEVVLDFFKHLYSDGKYSIDHIIDGVDCLKICKMFGLDQSTLVRSNTVGISKQNNNIVTNDKSILYLNPESVGFNKIDSDLPAIHFSSEDKSDIINFSKHNDVNDNQEFLGQSIISTNLSQPDNMISFDTFPNCQIQSTPKSNENRPELENSLPVNEETSKLSDGDLFDSITQISFSVNAESCKDYQISVTNLSRPANDNFPTKEAGNFDEIYKKLCIFTNEDLNITPEKYQQLPTESAFNSNITIPGSILESSVIITDKVEISDPCCKTVPSYTEVKGNEVVITSTSSNSPHGIVQSANPYDFHDTEALNNDIDMSYHSSHFAEHFISQNFNNSTESIILIDDCQNQCEKSDLFENIQFKIDSSTESLNVSKINEIEIVNDQLNKNSFEENESPVTTSITNAENSPLPLAQRLKLNFLKNNQNVCITISSDEELTKSKITSRTVINTKKKRSSDTEKIISEKVPMKRKSKKTTQEIDNEKLPKVKIDKVAKKRKSNDSKTSSNIKGNMSYETPIKQKPEAFNHFTPMPDYRSMPPFMLQKQCAHYGIKQKLSKTKSIKLLEEIFRHTHQVDDGVTDESMSSSYSSNNGSMANSMEGLSSDSGEGTKSSHLNDNIEFRNHLKTFYFQDILIYKPIDIKQLLSELKQIGMDTSLKDLNDYLDSQCILVCNSDDKKHTRPLKASKMVL